MWGIGVTRGYPLSLTNYISVRNRPFGQARRQASLRQAKILLKFPTFEILFYIVMDKKNILVHSLRNF